jgi:hypothetical protein
MRREKGEGRREKGEAEDILAHSWSLTHPSSNRINVFLRVVRRREDGFHDLASLFHVIDLGDDMDIELLPASATKDELTCNWYDDSLATIHSRRFTRDDSLAMIPCW